MDHADLAKRLGATTLFSRLPRDQLQSLLMRSPLLSAGAGDWLTHSSDGLKNHLVLLSGELEACRTWIESDGGQAHFSWRLDVKAEGPGFSLLSATNSRIRVQAVSDVQYLTIDGDALDALLGWSQLAGNLSLAPHLKVFHKVPLENVQQAFDRMVERTVSAGETIVTQGEPGDSYYIILSGDAEVWVTDPLTDETTRVAVLTDKDAFGEEALLLGGNRTATVRMNTPGRLLVLSKTDFDQLLKPNMVEEVSAERALHLLQQGEAKLLDCRYEMEYEESRIPGAHWVPLSKLRREGVFELDSAQTYIVYCRSGRRSNAAAFLLNERGIRALSLTGGIKDWPYEVDDAML
jgi:CRP-like cAMP-binding protein